MRRVAYPKPSADGELLQLTVAPFPLVPIRIDSTRQGFQGFPIGDSSRYKVLQ